jgi:hypothetical protein
MDYEKVYSAICKRGQIRKLKGYVERHHIIMKSHGGSNDPSNITTLTAREHFLAHWLLARIFPKDYKTQAAFKMMADVVYGRRYVPSSRTIAEAREAAAKLDSISKLGKKKPREQVEKGANTRRGTHQTDLTKTKIVLALAGRVRTEMVGRVTVNNGETTKMISPQEVHTYIEKGWVKGRLPYTRFYNGKLIKQ